MTIKVLNEFLPPAREVNLGAVKVGTTLNIDDNDTLNIKDEQKLTNKITNCFTKIPCPFTLELNNDIITLKTGSKAYKVDSTFDFIWSDVTYTLESSEPHSSWLILKEDGTLNEIRIDTETARGITIGTEWIECDGENYYLPFGIITYSSTGEKYLDPTFNTYGYIGSYVFTLPGLQGLIPNGRDVNTALKNTEFIYDTVHLLSITSDGTYIFGCGESDLSTLSTDLGYEEEANINKLGDSVVNYAACGKIVVENGLITEFVPKRTPHLVDYNDLSKFSPIADLGALAWKDKVGTSDIAEGGIAQYAVTGLEEALAGKAVPSDIKNGTLTIKVNNSQVQTFSANQETSVEANITVPVSISDLTDDTDTTPIEKANTLTGLEASVSELNYVEGVTSNVQTQLNSKLEKVTYEYNKELSVSSGNKILIGSFGVYDTNITIDISATTSQTYSGKLVIATQNYTIEGASVYGDPSQSVAQALYITPSSVDNKVLNIYFNPQSFSKNLFHIRVVSPYSEPTNLVQIVDSIPGTATLQPTNILDTKQETLISGTNIKSINGASLLGSGNIDIDPMPPLDETVLDTTEDGKLTVIGIKEKRTGNANYDWIGTLAQYNALGTWNDNWTYFITDDTQTDNFASKSLDNLTAAGEKRFDDKQDLLVSGTNIKTLNNNSLLGSGNIEISTVTSFADIQGQPTDNTNLAAALGSKLTASDIINATTSTATNKALSANIGKELSDRLDNVEGRGRFLSQWNAATGQPTTQPTTTLPYTYKSGDYYTIKVVSEETNYRPSGTSYTGAASTVVETEEIAVDDTYLFDGTNWLLQLNHGKAVSFANLTGLPTDNTNLATALGAKQDNLPDQTSQSGKFLTTNGTTLSWGTVDAFPSQSGNAGKVLTTNGTTVSWGDKTYRGTFVLGTQYYKGDIVESSDSYFIAKQDNINVATYNVANWLQINNDNIVRYLEASDNVERPIGLVSEDASAGNYAGPVRFTLQNTPKINASTGVMTVSGGIIGKTEEQTENSTKVATTAWTTTKLSGYQPTLVSGTNIKTINNQTILGSGNLDVGGLVDIDEVTINKNTDDELQAIGFIDKNTGNANYNWVGTLAEYTALTTKDPNWLYYITDDTEAGGGNVKIDEITVTKNTDDEIQTVGVINNRDNATPIKTWSGTRAQYNAITTKDSNTLYNVTGDTAAATYEAYTKTETDTAIANAISTMLSSVYPVGSLYLTISATCPLQTLIPGSTWALVSQDRVLQGAGSRGAVGTTINESLPNAKGHFYALDQINNYSGIVYRDGTSSGGYGGSGAYDYRKDVIDLSRASSTYKDGAPVQQNAYLINVFRRTG